MRPDALRQLRPSGGAGYPSRADGTVVAFAMIASAAALENPDDVLSVKGLDAIHDGTPEAALGRIARGFPFVTVGSDARLVAAGARQGLEAMRATPARG